MLIKLYFHLYTDQIIPKYAYQTSRQQMQFCDPETKFLCSLILTFSAVKVDIKRETKSVDDRISKFDLLT